MDQAAPYCGVPDNGVEDGQQLAAWSRQWRSWLACRQRAGVAGTGLRGFKALVARIDADDPAIPALLPSALGPLVEQ
jgi:hypothetical protein